MGFLSGLCSLVGSCVSSICSVGKAIFSGVGRAISAGASILTGALSAVMVGGPLGPVVGQILGLVAEKFVSETVTFLAKSLGITVKQEVAEEIGYRVAEAVKKTDWMERKDFPSFADYYGYLKEKLPIVETEAMDLPEKVNYQAVGVTVLKEEIGEREGIVLPDTFMEQAALCRMEPEEQLAVIEAFKQSGYSRVEIKQYLQGLLPENDMLRLRDALLAALQKHCPDRDPVQLRELLRDWRAASLDKSHQAVAKMYRGELQEQREKLLRDDPMIFDAYGMAPEDKKMLREGALAEQREQGAAERL
ncbi:MAG: hypothetical protein Q4F00_02955 [bacterium]|nr:hypothetical protein [bacterium]